MHGASYLEMNSSCKVCHLVFLPMCALRLQLVQYCYVHCQFSIFIILSDISIFFFLIYWLCLIWGFCAFFIVAVVGVFLGIRFMASCILDKHCNMSCISFIDFSDLKFMIPLPHLHVVSIRCLPY